MAEIVSIGAKLIVDPLAALEEQRERELVERDKAIAKDTKYSRIRDSDIRDQIKGLTVFGEAQIFKIIRNNDEKFSKNGNGIFFNLSKIKVETRKQIIDFLLYCKKYESKLKNEEKDRDEYKKYLPEEE